MGVVKVKEEVAIDRGAMAMAMAVAVGNFI